VAEVLRVWMKLAPIDERMVAAPERDAERVALPHGTVLATHQSGGN
jgi:hypothetical protein